ncbi:unnamed protein product [Ambrosiozyma monospora]|uniref:Unnamed protein product n=1 Tax=Ambrosiozyma monospora TaxID=43982 RepID=A0ACB5T8I6_AMBMO|nr:unnamed protein product [Ambrosiozyma monospora]
MPSAKRGTVSDDVAKLIGDTLGTQPFRERNGRVALTVARCDFNDEEVVKNIISTSKAIKESISNTKSKKPIIVGQTVLTTTHGPGLPQHSNQQREGQFTCISCQIRFPSPELQRIHMKTEWHRYNLKRRVANLAPIASHVFQLKIANKKSQNQNEDEYGFYVHSRRRKTNGSGGNGRQLTKKDLRKLAKERGRKLGSNGGLTLADRALSPAESIASRDSHFSLGTVHSDLEVSSNYDTDDLMSELSKSDYDDYITTTDNDDNNSSDDSNDDHHHQRHIHNQNDGPVELPLTTCFYCGHEENAEVESNIKHMFRQHGLYIPERSYLVDVEGLLRYIADSVSIKHECLKCGFTVQTGKRSHQILL